MRSKGFWRETGIWKSLIKFWNSIWESLGHLDKVLLIWVMNIILPSTMFNGPGVLAWEIPWTEVDYSPCGHKRVRHSLATKQQQDFNCKYFYLCKWWSHATCSSLQVDLPCSPKSQLYREVLTIQKVSTSAQSLKTTSLKMAPVHREGPVGVHFQARGGWGASLSGPAPGSTCGHTLWMFRRYWWLVWDLYHFHQGFSVKLRFWRAGEIYLQGWASSMWSSLA